MTQENTVVVEDEKLNTEATVNAGEENTTNEGAEGTETSQDDNLYKKEVERLEEINRQKAGALEEERKKRKAVEKQLKEQAEGVQEVKGLTAEEAEKLLDAKLEARLAKRDFENLLKETSGDEHERKLIAFHYENSIVKSGDVASDLSKAVAIANAHLVNQAKQVQAEREGREAYMTGFQGGNPTSFRGRGSDKFDPIQKGASSILDKLGAGDAKKFLNK